MVASVGKVSLLLVDQIVPPDGSLKDLVNISHILEKIKKMLLRIFLFCPQNLIF